MVLYHATRSALAQGQVIVATSDCLFYPEVLSLLEAVRPLDGLSRSRCVFAADSVVAATSFLNSQHSDSVDPIRVFEVFMPLFHKAPFRLIHEMYKRIKANQSAELLALEYWQPKHDWFFWEFFGPEFEVIREVPAATVPEMVGFQLSYDSDTALSKSF